MSFITEEEVSATALKSLVGAALDKSATISKGVVGLLATLKAAFFAAFPSRFPKILKKFPIPLASIVLSETFLILVLLHIMKSPSNNFFPFQFSC